ncbi:hypothetical protein RHMOL_Rhmol06G0169000 [Rhododendron molle]|uniref:Uncharacterized protein n=1 Tax=Rhododendron molle TaxID=49168 RepID=A0ACC0NDR9_RHOML|nr:hypothetical protein RHMOL_Rhmol06G0169000 [Rhododendron molle]
MKGFSHLGESLLLHSSPGRSSIFLQKMIGKGSSELVATAVSGGSASVHGSQRPISSCRFWEPTHRASQRLATGVFGHLTRSDLTCS